MQQVTKNQLDKYVKSIYFGQKLDDNCKMITQTANYSMYNVYDTRVDSNFLELTGKMPDNYWIYLRSNYQSIQESASVSNQFMLYVGMIVMIAGVFIMYFVSNQYTKPILRLAAHAKNMQKLDFSTRYKDNRDDEIGVLGNSMNALSDRLEKTISELKTANNELQLDLQMVKKLLSLNQLEFGNDQVHFEHFDLRSVIQSIVNSSDILFRQKEVTLSYHPDEEPIMVWADEYMIEEVVSNYVSNALNHVKYENKIEIKTIRKGDHVCTSVFNTGDPIPEEDMDKIWSKFYKVDKARTREYGGNGIGLSIVKAVMDAHNQKFGVKNYDNGVEFWFELDVKSVD